MIHKKSLVLPDSSAFLIKMHIIRVFGKQTLEPKIGLKAIFKNNWRLCSLHERQDYRKAMSIA